MFYIFNKDKLVSYFVTVFTVIILFLTAYVIKPSEKTIETSVKEFKIKTIQNTNELNKENNTKK